MWQPLYLALGDSITTGEGDPAPEGGSIGWSRRLCSLLSRRTGVHYDLTNLAVNRARVGDVLERQLPVARTMQPALASVTIGGNDVRDYAGAFDEARFGRQLGEVFAGLVEQAGTVFTITLPDVAKLLPLPPEFVSLVREQMELANHVIRRTARDHGVLYFDPWVAPEACAEISKPEFWSDDRVHPSAQGHRLIAGAFADMLISSGRLPTMKSETASRR